MKKMSSKQKRKFRRHLKFIKDLRENTTVEFEDHRGKKIIVPYNQFISGLFFQYPNQT
jgi:hypothetical protein